MVTHLDDGCCDGDARYFEQREEEGDETGVGREDLSEDLGREEQD